MTTKDQGRGRLPAQPLYYTVVAAAQTLSVSRATLYRFARADPDLMVKVGRRTVIHRDAMEQLIHSREADRRAQEVLADEPPASQRPRSAKRRA